MKDKPEGIGIMIKNVCCTECGVMYAIEIAAGSAEMRTREFNRDGILSGAGYCLRLSEGLQGSGRIILGDSAFASVVAATELYRRRGCYFIGHVKTATRKFPKKYLQREVEYDNRGDSRVATTTVDGLQLLAVGWNEGKRDLHGNIKPKTYISSCGTTLPGPPHQKKRYANSDNGSREYYVSVPRPAVIGEYHAGCQKIDVHNHLGQGSLGLESRRTPRWEFRFWQTIQRFNVVDSFLAYKKWHPDGDSKKFKKFVLELTDFLIDNTEGRPAGWARYRPNPEAPVVDGGHGVAPVQHQLGALRDTAHMQRKRAEDIAENRQVPQRRLTCRHCGTKTSWYCVTCTGNHDNRSRSIIALCGPSKPNCSLLYHEQAADQAAVVFPADN